MGVATLGLSAPPSATPEPGWSGARRLLRGPLRTLIGGQMLIAVASGVVQIAFAQFVLFDIGKGATPARIAAVLAATLLPFSLVGPVAGVVIDRWSRRGALVVTSMMQAALAVVSTVTVLIGSEAAAFAGMLLLLSISRFAAAAKGAALPRTVHVDELVTANGISAVAGMVGAFAGAVAAASFVGHSAAAGFVVGATLDVAAATVYAHLPEVGGAGGGLLLHRVRAAAADFVDGLRATARTRTINRPLAAMFLHRLLLGGGCVLLVLIADSSFQLRIAGYGLTLAVTGIAALIGSLLAPVCARRWPAHSLLPLTFLPPALAAALGAVLPDLPVLAIGLAVTAAAFQVLKVRVDALVGANTSDAVRGRVFAAYDALYNGAFVLAALLMVPLWAPDAERFLLGGLSVAFVSGWLLFARLLRPTPATA